ncbi:MAG: methylated-DNA--[protein]-cysteine S-methyltransferase [Patescibacteria group bacterium]
MLNFKISKTEKGISELHIKDVIDVSELERVPLDPVGTPFQKKVWNALLKIKKGEVKTYAQVAEMIGMPTAVRAVASAIAKNNIAILIPCHRVVRSDGTLGEYRWGKELKKKLLQSEGIQV